MKLCKEINVVGATNKNISTNIVRYMKNEEA